MTVVPTDSPVTIPFVPIEPTAVLLLLHVPPGVTSLKFVVRPKQTLLVPKILAGNGFTVAIVVVIQPVGNVYITILVPARMPVIQPLVLPTLAIDGETELHVPPKVGSDKHTLKPLHTGALPVMLDGKGLTVRIVLDVVVPHELVTL